MAINTPKCFGRIYISRKGLDVGKVSNRDTVLYLLLQIFSMNRWVIFFNLIFVLVLFSTLKDGQWKSKKWDTKKRPEAKRADFSIKANKPT